MLQLETDERRTAADAAHKVIKLQQSTHRAALLLHCLGNFGCQHRFAALSAHVVCTAESLYCSVAVLCLHRNVMIMMTMAAAAGWTQVGMCTVPQKLKHS